MSFNPNDLEESNLIKIESILSSPKIELYNEINFANCIVLLKNIKNKIKVLNSNSLTISKLVYKKDIYYKLINITEAIIAKDAASSLNYAFFMNERFILGEDEIIKSSGISFSYLTKIKINDICLKQKLEKSISRDENYSLLYFIYLKNKRFKFGEKVILNSNMFYEYIKYFDKFRFPKAEKYLLNKNNKFLISNYFYLIRKRVKFLEKTNFFKKEYFKLIMNFDHH